VQIADIPIRADGWHIERQGAGRMGAVDQDAHAMRAAERDHLADRQY
jgi:hypothetical protein